MPRETATSQLGVDVLLGELLLSAEDVARLLRVNSDTVQNLHRTGQLRAVKVGKHNRWRPGDVRRFVESLEGGAK